MTKTWCKIVLCAVLAAGLGACDSKDSQSPAEGAGVEQGQTRALLIMVSQDGKITLDKIPVTVEELGKGIETAKAAGPCIVWYYRDKLPGPTPAYVKPIVDVLMASKLPVSVATKPDFSDLVAKLTEKKQVSAVDAMRNLRLSVLADGPQKLGLQPSAKFPHLFGVMMEIPDNQIISTVVSLSSGEASLLTNTNFGVLNGKAPVQAAAEKFVTVADAFIDDATPTHEVPYPAEKHIRFYLMTYQGIRVIDQDLEAVASGKTKFTALYAAGQNVLTELKNSTDKKMPTTLPSAMTQPTTQATTTAPTSAPASVTEQAPSAATQPTESK